MVTSSTGRLLAVYANRRGVLLFVDTDGHLKYFIPSNVIDDKLRQSLRQHRDSVKAFLVAEAVTAE